MLLQIELRLEKKNKIDSIKHAKSLIMADGGQWIWATQCY